MTFYKTRFCLSIITDDNKLFTASFDPFKFKYIGTIDKGKYVPMGKKLKESRKREAIYRGIINKQYPNQSEQPEQPK